MSKQNFHFTPEESTKQAKANIALERLAISATALTLMQKITAGTLSSETAIKQITQYYKNHS